MPAPDRLLFIDVETTGLHNLDRVVSLGIVALDTRASGADSLQTVHLIFNPGRQSHPRAAEVHGYPDGVLRHQDAFAQHVDQLYPIFAGAPRIVAHNAAFDRRFVEREFRLAGRPLPDLDYFCTMQAYRQKTGGPCGLMDVLVGLGLSRSGRTHGALEDAWLAMQVYCRLMNLPAPAAGMPDLRPSNYREPTRRRAVRAPAAAAAETRRGANPLLAGIVERLAPSAALLLYVAKADGLVDSEISVLTDFARTETAGQSLSESDLLDLVAMLMDLPTDETPMPSQPSRNG